MTTKFQQLQNNAHFYSFQTLKPHLINPASAYSILLEAVLGAGLLLPTGTFISVGFPISPKRAERPLCRRVAGEREKVRKGRWEGEREEAPFRSSHQPPRAC